jgi:3-methyladenine DNA glycosylase AlkC
MTVEKLKNHYNKPFITGVADAIKSPYPNFDKEQFIDLVFDKNWADKELKDRMRHIAVSLGKTLPGDYAKAVDILKILAPSIKGISEFGGFLGMFCPDFVELYGLDAWEVSVAALEEFTKYSSSEFAVRPFIKQDAKKMMAQMQKWAENDNHHIRRLASEGCRPRLPWAMALPEFKKDPSPILPILHILKDDDSEYVRRSVANNLNDIAKDHPEKVIDIAKQWHGKNTNTDRLVKHACRTLLKKADKKTLEIFGFSNNDAVIVSSLQVDKNVIKIGDDITFTCNIEIKKSGKLRFEYAVDFMKANGKTSRKIFQLKESDYQPCNISFNKKHSFKELTTRKHYSGKHNIAVLANGVEVASLEFLLKE